MIPRAVLAVVLAVALLGVALPAVEEARVEATDRTVRGEIERLEHAARGMLAADEAAPTRGARREVVVRVPAAAWSRSGLAHLVIGGRVRGPGGRRTAAAGTVAYRIARRPERVVRLSVPVVSADGRPLVLRKPGTHRLVLRVARRGNRTVVVVGRVTGGERPSVRAGDRPGRQGRTAGGSDRERRPGRPEIYARMRDHSGP